MKDKKKHLKREKNILYTGFGDKGTTTLYSKNRERVSKSSHIIEALGSVDELNAYLGVAKVYSEKDKLSIKIGSKKVMYTNIIGDIQQVLFIVQAELAGSDMTVGKAPLNDIEKVIESISDLLPPITSFTISGGTIAGAKLDVARTLARRAERRIVSVLEDKIRIMGEGTIAYLNRLSSVLFALSRYANHLSSVTEEHPTYLKKK